mmetsp:Transcript_95439/g.273739  ORF Transcript_95439/g.273739 Transcript_95439/m.273739 type:complete len:364 (+) Transcript_95439:381-1472(+)
MLGAVASCKVHSHRDANPVCGADQVDIQHPWLGGDLRARDRSRPPLEGLSEFEACRAAPDVGRVHGRGEGSHEGPGRGRAAHGRSHAQASGARSTAVWPGFRGPVLGQLLAEPVRKQCPHVAVPCAGEPHARPHGHRRPAVQSRQGVPRSCQGGAGCLRGGHRPTTRHSRRDVLVGQGSRLGLQRGSTLLVHTGGTEVCHVRASEEQLPRHRRGVRQRRRDRAEAGPRHRLRGRPPRGHLHQRPGRRHPLRGGQSCVVVLVLHGPKERDRGRLQSKDGQSRRARRVRCRPPDFKALRQIPRRVVGFDISARLWHSRLLVPAPSQFPTSGGRSRPGCPLQISHVGRLRLGPPLSRSSGSNLPPP